MFRTLYLSVRHTHSLATPSIPSIKGLPIIGTSLSILASGSAPHFHEYVDKRHRQLGPIFREKLGQLNAIFISDPSAMRKVFMAEGKYPSHFLPECWTAYNQIYNQQRGLLFMEGREWLHYRKILNKHFLKDYNAESYRHLHEFVIRELVSHFATHLDADVRNLEHMLYTHSIKFLMANLMGQAYFDCHYFFDGAINELATTFEQIFATTSKLNNFPLKWAVKLNLPSWKRFVTSMSDSLEAAEKMIIKMLSGSSSDGLFTKLKEENIPQDVLTALIVDMLIAAGDTTAYTTQWALYLMSRHQDIQFRLLQDGTLIKGVMRETLRLYPAAVFISRILTTPIDVLGYEIPAGEIVFLSLYTMGRDESNYPSPEKFWPERWNRLNNSNDYVGVRNPNAYVPFAMGVRSCLGKKIAETQMALTVNRIVNIYHLSSDRDIKMVLKMVPVPEVPLKLKADERL